MYKKIMVPLDGSELAECVLPHVEAFIKGFNTISYRGEYVITSEMLAKRESETKSSAKDYLDKIVNRLKHEGVALHAEVIVGRVTESLANYAVENDIDLILIATHGHSGVTRWVLGNK
jgi:nucleotide-binding universal stress UspA family protein